MTAALRKIDPAPFRNRLELPPADFGRKPELRWLPIDKLRVDPTYQRDIRENGMTNLRKIAAGFKWSRFSPLVVAPADGGLFVIIDGQHHALAAAVRGIAEVPCAIVEAPTAEQAEAFVTINSQRLAITPMQLHAARLAHGDADARELVKVLAKADVSICRYPIPASQMKPGETLAAGSLYRLLKRYGADVLVAALSCVTQTRKGNPGMLRAPVIDALCSVLDAEPDWHADMAKLIRAMQLFDFAKEFSEAGKRSYSERCSVASALVDTIAEHLERRLAAPAPDAKAAGGGQMTKAPTRLDSPERIEQLKALNRASIAARTAR